MTEWKVRIASLATFVASLAASIALDTRGVELLNQLPDGVRVVLMPVLVAASAWFAGRAARSRPDYLADSTVAAVRERLESRGQ